MAVLKSIGDSYFKGGCPTTLLPILTNLNVSNLKTLANLKIKIKKYNSGWEKEKSKREAEDKLKKVVAKSKK